MGLDIKKLRGMQKDIKKKAGGDGDNLFVYSNKITEEFDVRILEPRDNMGGAYFMYQEGWWIDGKFYPTQASFGGADVIKNEIDDAKTKKDKDLTALISATNSFGAPVLKREVRYLMPILQLDCTFDDEDEMTNMDVVDDMGKILVAKPTLLNAINMIVTSRQYQNKTEFGICDRKKGWNLTLSKTGKGKDTSYGATGWTEQMEMDSKYYGDKVPDVYELCRKGVKSDEYLVSVIRNYLYGDPIIEETDSSSTDVKEETKAKPSRGKAAKPEETKKPKRGRSLVDDAEAASELDGLD